LIAWMGGERVGTRLTLQGLSLIAWMGGERV
jgi:hypothetical protein